MTSFKRWNNIVGWAVFAIAALVYLMTMEPVSSLWDCSEFIATSYKLEVGHPPGAPLFMMLARLATLFAAGNPDFVGMAVNGMNSIASAFCILFLFWTITHLARRLVTRDGSQLTRANVWAILGAGIVGALAYTFTDTFWFSAIEGEVYALSSMFTALVVWLMLKWEEEADQPHSSRWIVLIAYMMGLSIGVHILNLLTIPALVFIYYFRTTEKVTFKGIVYATLIAGAILIFVNNIIIPYTVYVGAMLDLFFVNTLGLPVNSGMVLFALALIGGLGWASWYTHRKGKVVWNIVLLSTTMILIGFSSYASVTIRAAANPPMNSNNPNNPHALMSVLNRDQYGDRPLLLGAYYSAPPEGYKEKSFYYLDEDGKYKPASVITGYTHSPEFVHFFPRMWDARKGEKEYKQWAAYRTKTEIMRDEKGEIVRDSQGRPMQGEVLDFGTKKVYDDGYEPRTIVEPTFLENLNYFFNYQLSYMYWRYFLWNFVGRQSDIQPTRVTITDGNWLSGIKWIDEKYLGPQDGLPREIADNKGRNTYYFLPFLLGLIGLIYQLNRDQRNFSIVMWLFIMTGIALVFYFNTSPGEPRERDYVYAGSFYAFCIWIGFGVLAIRDLVAWLTRRNNVTAAVAATVVCMGVPTILAAQNWDDHDRSGRYVCRDFGMNYLSSVDENGIIFTNGDNDTFPLWYVQEVEGYRTDVRVCNLSYLQTDWYIDQMKRPAYESAPLPISADESKYAYDVRSYNYVINRLADSITVSDGLDYLYSDEDWTKDVPGYGKLNHLPTNKLYIPVNADAAVASGTVAPELKDSIVSRIVPDFTNKRGFTMSEIASLDIINTNAMQGWKRPVYFAVTVGSSYYLGLEDYFSRTGLAYQVVPLKGVSNNIDTDKMYDNMVNKFRWGGIDKATPEHPLYLDENVRRMCNTHRMMFGDLVVQLIAEGKTDKALTALDLIMEKIPGWQVTHDLTSISLAQSYLDLGEKTKGEALLTEILDNSAGYLNWYKDLTSGQLRSVGSDYQKHLYIIQAIHEMSTSYELPELQKRIEEKFAIRE